MTKPLLALVGIFKNEVGNIAKTLLSAKPYIDFWCILDTGSSDGTQDVIRKTMEGVPGVLYEESFEVPFDFAKARNKVLELHELLEDHAQFVIMLSGDEVLEGGEKLKEFLQQERKYDAFCPEVMSGTTKFVFPRILRVGKGWRYRGKNQEIPLPPDGKFLGEIVPGVRIVHTASDPERRLNRVLEVDLPVLTQEVEDESKTMIERASAIFHLAQTHAMIAAECDKKPGGKRLTHQMIAMSLFLRYGQIAENAEGGAHDPIKALYAYALYFNIAQDLGFYTPKELEERLESLAAQAPNVPEIHYLLAQEAAKSDVRRGLFYAEKAAEVARTVKETPTHVPSDARIEWLSLLVAATCAKMQKNYRRAGDLAQRGLEAGGPKEKFEEFLGE